MLQVLLVHTYKFYRPHSRYSPNQICRLQLLGSAANPERLDTVTNMSSSQRYGKQGPYSSIEPISEERDSGHESDSTACSDAFLARKGALGSTEGKLICRSKKSQLALNWFRWGTLVALQLLIVILLSSILPNSAVNRDSGGIANVETGGDVNGIFTSGTYIYNFASIANP